MRIIGGRLKGKPILPPMGYGARPTTDFAREGLFNVLGNEYEFEDLQVLDLFGYLTESTLPVILHSLAAKLNCEKNYCNDCRKASKEKSYGTGDQ